MSAVAVDSTISRGVQFYGTTIGKKAVMAVTGVILFGFLIGHMVGNLQFFAGPEKLNGYAEKLREVPPLLWGVRIVLLASLCCTSEPRSSLRGFKTRPDLLDTNGRKMSAPLMPLEQCTGADQSLPRSSSIT